MLSSCRQSHHSQPAHSKTPAAMTTMAGRLSALLAFMVRAAGAVKFEQLLVLLGNFFLARGPRQAAGLFGATDRLGEPSGFRVRGGECSEQDRYFGVGEFAGSFGQHH